MAHNNWSEMGVKSAAWRLVAGCTDRQLQHHGQRRHPHPLQNRFKSSRESGQGASSPLLQIENSSFKQKTISLHIQTTLQLKITKLDTRWYPRLVYPCEVGLGPCFLFEPWHIFYIREITRHKAKMS